MTMTQKKIIFLVLDGVGDKPLKQLANKTPLEAAQTPHLDHLAKDGVCGVLEIKHTTAIPTSEQGHASLFGYDPKKYRIERGIFTAQGAGMKMKKGDVALRGNFGTIDKSKNMIDRRAGRIKITQPLINELNGMKINGVTFSLKQAGEHRIGIVMRGKGLSGEISDSDPHYGSLGKKYEKVKPLDKTKTAQHTADVLNTFLRKAHDILKNHSLNTERAQKGLPPANCILTRGASMLQIIPSFKKRYNRTACCIAGKVLYKQIGELLGMKLITVPGATGLPTTNLKGKVAAAQKALSKYDFVFLHIKAADSLAEDGNWQGKKAFLEKVDRHLKPLLALRNTLIVVTADHSTCCSLKRHCAEPVPLLVWGDGTDAVAQFSERACTKGKLGTFPQLKIMEKVLQLAKK